MTHDRPGDPATWPYATGEMAARVRACDWSATPLGPVERWPASLRTAVDMMLAMPRPATVVWGPQHVQIYNDAYVAIARDRHPALLGRPVAHGWADAYDDVILPPLEEAYAGHATRLVDLHVVLEGPGGPEERVFDTEWSPIRDASGAVAGVLQMLVEATDRVRSQTALRESETRHRLLIESWAQALWETDAEGGVVADSPSWRAYTGQTLEEWLGHGWLDAIHPDDRAYAARQWREAVATRGLVDAEFRLRAPDGGWRWTNVRAAPVIDGAGRIEKWAGMNIDIDTRRRAEMALRESEAMRGIALDAGGMGAWRSDMATRLLWGDARFMALWGMEPSDDPRPFAAFTDRMSPQGAAETEAFITQAVAAGEAFDGQLEIVSGPTAGRWVRWRGRADADGSSVVHGVSFDVTEQRKADTALRDSQELQTFLLTLSDALRPLSDPEAIKLTASMVLGRWLSAGRVAYAADGGDGETFVVSRNYVDDAPDLAGRFRYADYGQDILRQLAAGENRVQPDLANDTRLSAAERQALARLDIGASLNVPLVKAGALVGWLGVNYASAHAFTPREIRLTEETAERIWAAVERAKAQEALRASEDLLRVALDSGGMGAWTWDRRAGTVRAEAAVGRLWGMPTDERSLAGSPRGAVLSPEAAAWLADVAARSTAPGGEFHAQVQVADGAGASRWVELRGRGERDAPWIVNGVSFDITEQRLAEERLGASETLFRTLAEVIEDVFYVSDLDAGRLDYLSPAYEAIWGRPAAELIADLSRFVDTIHPDDRAEVDRARAAQARGEAVYSEYRIVRPDGEVRWILDRCFPIARGARRLSAGVASDITRRREADIRLRTGEERLRLLVESVRDHAIFTMDRAGLITSWPAGAAAVYGGSEAEALGRSAAMTFLPEDVACGVPEEERDMAAREGLAPNARWHLRRDGSRIFIDGSTQPLVGADGEVREFIKIGQDVTEARRVQAALVESEERLRLALEAGHLGAWDWDLVSGEVLWSDAHYRMQGYRPGEVTPSYEAWSERVHPEDLAATVAALEQARDHAGDYAHEFRALHPDGTIRWLSAHGRFFFDEHGTPNRMVGAMLDVTERREWEERLAVMVAELQHRTRNLIAVVRSIAGQTMAQTGPTETFRDEFNHRLEALARVQGLLSRSDAEPITIEGLIRLELGALGARYEPGRIEVHGPAVRIRHSVVQTLALALHELATNACKYGALSSDRGRLDVRWRTYADARGERLALEWTEAGGEAPRAGGDARRGYGRELIERALPYSLNANTSFEHDETGLRCTIDMPIERSKAWRPRDDAGA